MPAPAEGWQRPDHDRAFRVEHGYYDEQQTDGWDHDIDAQRVRTAAAANEAAPIELIAVRGLQPIDFTHRWNTAGPWVRGWVPGSPTAISTAREGAA